MIALASLRIVSTYSEMSPTWDEPGHMACGLQYLAQHVYRYEAQHPPLARVMSALGPYLAGARPMGIKNQDQEGVAVMYRDGHPERMLTRMRLGILPFFVVAAFVVWLWARRYFGDAAAVLATGMFTLVPTVLAHAGVATTDMPLTACLSAAFFSLLLWCEEPTWKHSLLLGATTALAVVSKFTALGYLPAAALFAFLAYLIVERPGVDGVLVRRQSARFARRDCGGHGRHRDLGRVLLLVRQSERLEHQSARAGTLRWRELCDVSQQQGTRRLFHGRDPQHRLVVFLSGAAGGEDAARLAGGGGLRAGRVVGQARATRVLDAGGVRVGHPAARYDQPREHRRAPHPAHLHRAGDSGGTRLAVPAGARLAR